MKRYAIAAILATGLALAVGSSAADAQGFPARPVTLIVPWPAGGSTDVGMRALASATEKHLGQSIVIENRPGGSGTLAPGQMAAIAKPDGYTLAQIPITVFRFPFMQKTTFDPATDFTYIIGVSGYTFGVVVRADSPWKTFADMLEYAKTHPGEVSYATPGIGSSLHITMEQIGLQRGIQFLHVPYKGSAETSNALLNGQVMATADSTGWAPFVQAGKFRLLVTWGAQRTKQFPDVPTLKELGYGIISNSPYGIAGPKNMDPAVVKSLHDAFKKGLEDPAFVATMEKYDQEPYYMSPADYMSYVKATVAEQKELIEKLGLKQ